MIYNFQFQYHWARFFKGNCSLCDFFDLFEDKDKGYSELFWSIIGAVISY